MRAAEAARAHASKLQVAIDGPAGAGKSTVGRALAGALDCAYLDTGLMYRAVTAEALKRSVSPADGPALANVASSLTFDISRDTGLLVNGVPAPVSLHSPEVDEAVSLVSAHPEVRAVLVERQRQMASDGCIVMVGRDIGTVVLPHAPVKLWVTASPEERAARRLRDFGAAAQLSEATVLEAIAARDAQDSCRKVAPLQRPLDAVTLDTGGLDPNQSAAAALSAVRQALKQRSDSI